MRTLPLFVATSLLAGLTGLAGAASAFDPLADIPGSYALADGRVAHLSVDDGRLYIELGGQEDELVPVAPDRYATRDGSLSLRYRPGPRRDDIVLGYWAAPRQASPTRLARLDRWSRGSAH